MQLQFHGACRQVTGSCYYLQAGGLNLLIDCGLYQERPLRNRNWEPFTFDCSDIDHLILTHAHLDHCGLTPRLTMQGFSGSILGTPPTIDLARIVLADSARIHEEDAEFKKKRHKEEGREGPRPVEPLYTVRDLDDVFPRFRSSPENKPIELNAQVTLRFRRAGHILGSSMIELLVKENGKTRRILFTGDMGQWNTPIVRDPEFFDEADYVIMESTYGDREHPQVESIKSQLEETINDTVRRGGNILIPTFAIERAQELMYYLSELVYEDRLPHLLIFLDSPMAVNVTEIFQRYIEWMDDEARQLFEGGNAPFEFPGMHLVRSVGQSKAINRVRGSCIVMAGSGMCTGGRIKHHLVRNISRPESTILFVGYQARHTLGRQILEASQGDRVRVLGKHHELRAHIERVEGLSAHADRSELLQWAGAFKKPPRRIFVTHGEEEAALQFAANLTEEYGYEVTVPQLDEQWTLE